MAEQRIGQDDVCFIIPALHLAMGVTNCYDSTSGSVIAMQR